jgi:hypothetical protein
MRRIIVAENCFLVETIIPKLRVSEAKQSGLGQRSVYCLPLTACCSAVKGDKRQVEHHRASEDGFGGG